MGASACSGSPAAPATINITDNREFVTWAKAQRLPITPIETPGKHTWLVWRDNLIHFTPLLFREANH